MFAVWNGGVRGKLWVLYVVSKGPHSHPGFARLLDCPRSRRYHLQKKVSRQPSQQCLQIWGEALQHHRDAKWDMATPIAALRVHSGVAMERSVLTPRFSCRNRTKTCLPDKQGSWPPGPPNHRNTKLGLPGWCSDNPHLTPSFLQSKPFASHSRLLHTIPRRLGCWGLLSVPNLYVNLWPWSRSVRW